MSDKDIVKMLRKIEGTSLPISVWKHYMLRAAREIEQNRIDLQEYCRDVVALTAERDRLKAALEEIADTLNRGPDSSQNWDVKSIYDIARKAPEAKE